MCKDSGKTGEVIILTRIGSLHDFLISNLIVLLTDQIGTKQMNELKPIEERKIEGHYLFRSFPPKKSRVTVQVISRCRQMHFDKSLI